jgi:DNA-binding transcriptional LysR family regulator
MRFRSFDSLRTFILVAKYLSFTAASNELNLTKGAVSYQINRLESELGFKVFDRQKKGIEITDQGRRLLQIAQSAFDDLERGIEDIRRVDSSDITIGMSTYFASRWLSPRLMNFMVEHTDIGLRIQPLIDLIDLRKVDIDMAIRWGKGDWSDANTITELIFPCPAMLSAGTEVYRQIESEGIEGAIAKQTLLNDRDDSSAWIDWFQAAGLDMITINKKLVIPDPNVRVQAVIDNQGVALNDALVSNEINQGVIRQYSDVRLDEYGYYLVYPQRALEQPAVLAFRDWIMREAETESIYMSS